MQVEAPAQTHESTWLTALSLFLFALPARALAGRFLTVDEAYHWIGRVDRFTQALREGDFAATNLIGHPGVTTLWLGAAGATAHAWLVRLGLLNADDGDVRRAMLRLPVAIVTALCISLAYPLLRRLLGGRTALLAALLMAGERFLAAHSQLLHLDALLTSFMTLSLLAALCATRSARGGASLVARGWWALSAVTGGLALLTKSPAITLVPMVGLIAAAAPPRGERPATGERPRASGLRPLMRRAPRVAGYLALWCIVAAAVWVALWPAAWLDPLGAAGHVALQASADGGSPHGWGNFFLGRAIADPGPLFYPLTIALRLAPWTLAGAALYAAFGVLDLGSAALAIRGRRPGTSDPQPGLAHPDTGSQRRSLLLLLFFLLAFAAAMSVLPKKFDRYALPVFPALDILAAAGIIRAAESRTRLAGWLRRHTTVGWSAIVLALGLNLAWYHPYELAYFNPLLGGGTLAAQIVPVGWGEGYELAGEYIAAQPNGADRPAAARYEPVLGPFVPAGAAPLAWWEIPGRVDYAVLYIDQLQRDDKPETFRPLLEEQKPVYTVRIKGIDYAYVYQIAPPVATPLPADFGPALHLRGYALDTSAVRASGYLTLTLEWQAQAATPVDYALFAHIFDADGERVAQVDVPPGGERAPTAKWQPDHYYSLVQRIPLPANLPSGAYRIALGVYDSATFERLPLRSPPRPPLPQAGADALVLDPFELP